MELDPQLTVYTYVLTDGAYVNAGVFTGADVLTSVVLGWVAIPMEQLGPSR